jgi:plastocyanin
VGRRYLTLSAVAALAALAAAPAHAGTLAGRVVFQGEPPILAPIEVVKDREVCGETLPSEALVVSAKTRGVRWAVVSVEGGAPAPADAPREIALENLRCRFVPHVLAVQVGAEVAVTNGDPLLHNLRAWLEGEPRRQVFNVVQPTQGQVTRRTLKRAGAITVTCDTHLHMLGYVLAFDHPWFAVTDEDGAFRIDGLPAGTWRVSLWHESWTVHRRTPEGRLEYGPPHLITREVTIPAEGVVTVNFGLGP